MTAATRMRARSRDNVQRWPGELVQRVVRLDEGADGFPRSWIMLFPVGRFTHPEYGKLNFTRARLARIKELFDRRVRHIDIALDADHAAARGDTRATGWIEQLELRDPAHGDPQQAGLWGLIRWTPYGARLLKDQEYRYFSPEFGPWRDPESGQEYQDVLIGGGLTNRPFLKCMEAIQLAGEGASVSRAPWGSVKKSTLPRSCFLIQGDPDDKSTWKLPVYEGAGSRDAQGHYTKRGALNINGVRAAIDAIGGARTGQKMSVPPAVRAKLEGWMKRYGAGSGSDSGSSDGGDKQASEGTMGTKQVGAAAGAGTGIAAGYKPGGDSTRVTRRREEQSGEIDQAAARAWLEGRRTLRERADDEDEAATEEGEDEQDEFELDDEESEDGYELADSAQDDDMEMADGEDGFDRSSNTHGRMTCSAEDHQHGKYGPHSHDGDADHSDAPLKDDGKDDGEDDAGDEEYAEPGSDDTEEYDEADGDGPDEGDEEEAGAKPAKKPAARKSRGSKKASEHGSPQRQQGQQGGRRHVGDEARQVTLAEQSRRLAEVEAKAKRLEEANARMAYQLYETEVGKTLAGWQSQTFQFKEGVRVKDGKHVPVYRNGRIALSKVFAEKYREFMLHEAIRMTPSARKALNELLEASFVGTVDLTARGSSFDQETRLTRGGNAGRKPAGAEDSERLQQRAEQIAQERGKSLSEASDAELFSIYEQAGKEINYR